MGERLFLASKILTAVILLLFGVAILPTLMPATYLIAFLLLILLGVLFYLEKRVKSDRANYESTSQFYRLFRHELMNHLQIISCLSQLGKQERLVKTLGGLNEKLKIFGEISGLPSPVLMQALGDFIFSLPAETTVTLDHETPFNAGDTLAAEAAQFVRSLTVCLREGRPGRVSLKIFSGKDGRYLEIAAASPNSEDFEACLAKEQAAWPSYVKWQKGQEDGSGLLLCSIPLKTL